MTETLTLRFDSWGAFLRELDRPVLCGKYAAQSTTGSQSFTGTQNWGEALKLAQDGWQAKAHEIEVRAAPIVDMVTNLVERYDMVMDYEGMSVDIPAYLNGEPECWNRFSMTYSPMTGVRHMRIVFNCAASAGIDRDSIEAKGAGIAALIQALEFSGTRVELILVNAISAGIDFEVYIEVKKADQDLDMPRVAFALAHPSMLRRIVFRVYEVQERWAEIGPGHNYGRPKQAIDQGDLYIGRSFLGEPEWQDEKSVEQWIIKTLREQGVKFHNTEGN